jgi:hypothetical protein
MLPWRIMSCNHCISLLLDQIPVEEGASGKLLMFFTLPSASQPPLASLASAMLGWRMMCC